MSLTSRITAIVAATAALLGGGVGPVATAPAKVNPVTTNAPQPPRDVRARQIVPLLPVTERTRVPAQAVAGPALMALEAVRWCESRDSYTAENPVSSASGAFQFISSTWEAVTGLPSPASRYPRDVQDAAFLELWDNGAGASHWQPSRSCWAPLLAGGARG